MLTSIKKCYQSRWKTNFNINYNISFTGFPCIPCISVCKNSSCVHKGVQTSTIFSKSLFTLNIFRPFQLIAQMNSFFFLLTLNLKVFELRYISDQTNTLKLNIIYIYCIFKIVFCAYCSFFFSALKALFWYKTKDRPLSVCSRSQYF